MKDYKKEMLDKYPSYRLDCIVMETVEDILKDIPDFAEYFAICHKQAEWEWMANYKRGQKLAQQEEQLLAKGDAFIIEELLVCAPRKDALGESRWEFVKKYEDYVQSFFPLHMMAMSSKIETDNRFACLLGIQDGNPSPDFLKLAEMYIAPNPEQPCGWSPFIFHDLF